MRSDHNDDERVQWVQNDEGLYVWWRQSKLAAGTFVRANREQIDEVIDNVLSGSRKAHYLIYG